MSRIKGVQDDEAGWIQRRVFGMAAKQLGAVPEPLRVMAKSGGVMWAAGAFQTCFDRAKSLEPRIKILASLKAASMVGCLF
jgi:hypothetical protein